MAVSLSGRCPSFALGPEPPEELGFAVLDDEVMVEVVGVLELGE